MSQTKTRLILTRKLGEKIKTNGPVEFTILATENGRTRVMAEADPSTRVWRGELPETPRNQKDEPKEPLRGALNSIKENAPTLRLRDRVEAA